MFKLVMLLLLASCATPKNDSFCVEKKDEANLVKKLSTILSTMHGSEVKLKELERSCHKIKYHAFESVQVVVYRLPGMANALASTVNYTEGALQQACWNKALSDIAEIDRDGRYKKLLDLHQKMNSFEWQDLDVGPNKWVKCSEKDQEKYYGSLITLLHELNHEVKNFKKDDVCLYLLEKNDYLCFTFDQDLPRRSLGRLDLNIIPLEAGREALINMQDIYLINIDQEVSSLLDELYAYTLTLKGMQQVLKVKGGSYIFTEGKRNIALVSMFQLIVKRYFERLKLKDPKAYAKAIEQNREPLKKLLQISNDAYIDWVKEMKSFQEKEKKAEKTFRRLFKHASPFYTDLGWSPK
ncbi:MAG: hypothetical protein H0V66_01135 [Bdellovibrionales bacterium]|nr:hypothetical protein [Bdellovibrionales bacterium]